MTFPPGLVMMRRKKNAEALQLWLMAQSKTQDIHLLEEIDQWLNPQTTSESVTVPAKAPTSDLQAAQTRDRELSIKKEGPSEEQKGALMSSTSTNKRYKGGMTLDQWVDTGFRQVNTGRTKEAIEIFDDIIKAVTPPPLGALLGRGTANALAGKLVDAIQDFSQSIALFPHYDDAWKRRGQARAARGNLTDAISDLTESIRLKKDADSYLQRGLIYYRQQNFSRAGKDFNAALELNPECSISLNHLGLCKTATGLPWEVRCVGVC